MNSKIFKGDWFLPEIEEFALPGELIINQQENDFKLVLYGSRHIDGESFTSKNLDCKILPKIILGRVNGITQKLTLVDLNGFFSTCKSINKNLYKIEYQIQIVFEQIHFKDFQDKIFDNLYLGYDIPNLFFGRRKSFDFDSSTYDIKTIKNEDYSFEYNNYNFSFCKIPNAKIDEINCVEIVFFNYFKVQSSNLSCFSDLFLLLSKLETLISLFVGYELQLLNAFFKNGSISSNKIHIKNYKIVEKRNLNLVNQHFIGLDKISFNNLSPKLIKWLEIYDSFESCISLFTFAIQPIWKRGSRNLHHNEFTNIILNIVQAIEGYYKKDNSITFDSYLSDFSYKKTQIISKIKGLKEKNEFSQNEVNFINNNLNATKKGKNGDLKSEVKLKNIILFYCNENKTALSNYIEESRFDAFARDLKSIRDSLSHMNHNNAEELEDNFQIYDLFNLAQFLFLSILFSKIGFTQEEIQKMLEKVRTFG